MFAAAAEDKEVSQLLLETLLGIRVGRVKVNVEHTFLYSSDFRSVRLDVFASDEVEVRYNMEMENGDREALPQRSRYHQAEMDVMSLKPGEDFSELKPVYVVFICTFDPFGRGLYRYTFTNRCKEEDFPLKDGASRVFLNIKGTKSEIVPEELVNLLHYLENSTDTYVEEVQDPNVNRLHERVRKLKRSREWEARYMQFDELLREREQKGRSEGMNHILELTDAMIEAGEISQIRRLRKEPEFLAAMLEKYHLEQEEQ